MHWVIPVSPFVFFRDLNNKSFCLFMLFLNYIENTF